MSYIWNHLLKRCYTYSTRYHFIRYIIAALSVAVALLLTLSLHPLLKSTVFSLFFAAVTFSAWYGGLETGLLATVLSILACDFFLAPETDNLILRHGANFLHFVLFTLVAVLVSSLYARLHKAKQKVETNLVKLQLSEEKYRRIVDTASEGIWLLNDNLHTEFVNEQLASMLGYRVSEMNARSFEEFITSTNRTEMKKIVERWQNGSKEKFDCCFRAQNGSELWAIVSSTPIFTSEGNFNGVLTMLTDITARKGIEIERTQLLEREQVSRREAEAANRCKDEFLAMLSHELRSPLNPIIGWAEILQSKKLNSEKTDYALKAIERNAKLQAKLIEDLLNVSRILQGKLSIESHRINLLSVIEATIETVRLAAEEKAISLNSNHESFHPEMPSHRFDLLGDSKRLQQIFWNLLLNAIKFTPHGGRIDIELSFIANQNFAQIQVKDTGIGIDSEFLPHVFESFRQADNSTTRKFGGLGLGLAIVRQLVELHGGTVEADSLGKGQGATFIVNLPLLTQESEAIEISHSDTDLYINYSYLTNLKILVVDDEADIRDLLVSLLEQYGAIVTTAVSAEHALEILAVSEQDLMISDIGMPNVNGYALMRQVRNSSIQHRQIPAIALTGYASDFDIQQSHLAGFDKIIAKPIEQAKLISAISSMNMSKTYQNI
ncbi:multi-sensor hybrid histidine kinase [Calothrix sp. NIES-4071]|nr:multi-sensor hybrid histidine kinase [Calothrix sp. NIES-4071]BAZ59415.1 multi-sensor hybrid histidine kinase [Calothrix sp. NIES-4105]